MMQLSSIEHLAVGLIMAFGSRTREPILMKYGTQQQIRNSMAARHYVVKLRRAENAQRLVHFPAVFNVSH